MHVRRLGKFLLYGVLGLIGFVLLGMLTLKLALDRVPAYQDNIKAWVHSQTGLHIRFDHVAPSLRRYGPELYFDHLELRSKDDQRVLARAAGGRIGLDVWQLLRSGKFLAGRVRLDSPDIVIARLGPNEFALASEIELEGQRHDVTRLTLDDLPAGHVEIHDGRLTVQHWNAQLPELVLDRVDVDLVRESDRLAATMSARLPATLGGRMAVGATAHGLGDLAQLGWRIDLRAQDVEFAGWHLLLPEYLGNLAAGAGTFQLSAAGTGGDLATVVLNFSAADVVTRLGETLQPKFDQIAGAMTLKHTGDEWLLRGRQLRALRGGRSDPISQFDASWRAAAGGLLELHAATNYLRADGLLPLTGLLPQPDLRARLLDIAPTGEWQDARLDLDRGAVADPWRMQVHARFRDAGFAPVGKAPGLHGVSGEIAGTESGGHLTVAMQGGQLNWPTQWQAPVTLDAAAATLYWQRTADGLLVATPGLTAQNHDARIRAELALRVPSDGGSPRLTLVAQIADGNVAAAHNYLPRLVIPPKTLDWLDKALLAGRMPQARVVLNGPLRSFPFRDGSGVFDARADFEQGTFWYLPDWPELTNVSARVEFVNQGMSAEILGGTALGVKLEGGNAQFPDFKVGELTLHANAAGDAGEVLNFLRATPLEASTGRLFSSVQAQGDLHTGLDLFLPFKDLVHRKVLVHTHMDGVTLARPGLPLTANELNGDFDIDGGELARADFRGRLLGGSFHAIARTTKRRPLTRSQLDLRGTLSGDAVRAALSLPPAAALRGVADWRAVVRIAPEPARERSLHVSSSLVGLEMPLPAPLAKPGVQPLPSWVDVQWPAAGGLQVNLALGTLLRGVFLLDSDPDTGSESLAHAAVMFGDADPVFSDTQIVNVGGKIDRLDLGGWLQTVPSSKSAKPITHYLRTASLEAGEVDFIGLAFHAVTLDLAARSEHWHLAVGGPNLAGAISWPMAPDAAEPWDLHFDRVELDGQSVAKNDAAATADAAQPTTAAPATTPHSVPAMRFSADEFDIAKARLGSVQATITKRDDGISLDQLRVASPSFTLDAKGEWRGKDAGLGRIVGSWTSSDVEATLAQLGAPDVISAKTGHVDFDLNWVGAPTADALSEAVGHVDIALDKGQLLGVKPGAGRVLGLASIAALPRRLVGDFSDLTDKGLAFDTARADFDLRDGSAYTDNVLFKGPAAEIGLAGRIGLKAHDYDQTAVVTGNVGSTLPIAGIAGAFAAGPVVGGAVLLGTQVFKQQLKGLARAYYRITGGWDNPIIDRISKGASTASGMEAAKDTGSK
jgi:uncharacterized protein (TIGR02099 family)